MGGHGGSVVVDPAALRAAAGELDAVASRVEECALGWNSHRVRQRVQTAGWDPVSVQLRKNLITLGERAGLWMAGYARQVRAAQDALLAQAEASERAERAAADGMRLL